MFLVLFIEQFVFFFGGLMERESSERKSRAPRASTCLCLRVLSPLAMSHDTSSERNTEIRRGIAVFPIHR